MSVSMGDFVGTWKVNFVTGPLAQTGEPLAGLSYVQIGTGTNGATAPSLDAGWQVVAGFALLDAAGGVLFSTSDVKHQSGLMMLSGDQLRWKGYYTNLPLYIYISIAELWTPNDERTVQVYGCTVYGDPDQVGVWGGTGSPPPNPPNGGAPKGDGS
ncbi:MAG TPA: hypothetical protein VF173_10555 [Thermoanaerobaculia bacterium]|nr:hypothetical protein [Thermoanaerobaculia bacterium]